MKNHKRTFTNLTTTLLLLSLAACGGTDDDSPSADDDAADDNAADDNATDDNATDDNATDDDAADDNATDDENPMAQAVDLGAAGDFVILAKSGISSVPPSVVTGDIGVSPAAATFITGFSLTADASEVFATSPQVTGRAYAADYGSPTSSNLTTAVGDMEAAYGDAAGRSADVTELGAGNIGGMTLEAGVYKWGTGLLIPADVTLRGSATDVWIFQIAEDLTLSSATEVRLEGGALSQNVFWQVAGLVDLDTTAHCEGVILTKTSITLHTGASVNGRLLAQTAVDIDSSTVVQPAP
jgi:Ice-binding-like